MILTNFDDIPFAIEADPRSGVYTDWSIQAIETSEMVPYSSIWVTEIIGYEPARVMSNLDFERREDYFAFLGKLQSVGTLMVLHGYQSLLGTEVTLGNPPRVYDVLDNVKVSRIANQSIEVDGHVTCSVTFERLVDPVTRMAVVP